MDNSIDNILSDEPIVEPVAEQAAEPTPETPEVERDEKGRFAPKGETESASPAPVEEPEFDHAAIKAERVRRQTAEQRTRELEEENQALRNPPAPPPSIFEDEQGWQQNFGSHVVSTAVQQATLNSKLDMSEMMVRQANPDFEEMKEAFLELARENPALTKQALDDPHPWNKAYSIAKNHKAMAELGATDVTQLEAKLREKIMAEMAETPAPVVLGAPQTLSTERNIGTRTGPAWAGPASLEDMLR